MRTPLSFALVSLLFASSAPAAQFSWNGIDCTGAPVAGTSSTSPVALTAGSWSCPLAGLAVERSGSADRGRLAGQILATDQRDDPIETPQVDPAHGTITLEMRFDDFLVSGPPARSGGAVDAALRLQLEGTMWAEEFDGDSHASLQLEVVLAGVQQEGLAEFWHSEMQGRFGPYEEGLLVGTLAGTSGTSASLATVLTTAPVSVPVGTPFDLRVLVTLVASALDPYGPAEAGADFGNGIGFPATGVVLELPAGYSVDSLEAGVSGNSWSGSVPLKQQSWGSLKQPR